MPRRLLWHTIGMNPFRAGLVFGALVYLGALFVGAAWLLNRHAVFDGWIAVPVGGGESLAVRPADGGGLYFTPHRGLTAELLPFTHPGAARQVFPAGTLFDGLFLGRPLRVLRAEVLDRRPDLEVIEERAAGGAVTTHPVRPGTTLATAAGPVTVEGTGPWAGLIGDPAGRRMAALSWRDSPESEWIQGIFVEAGNWTTLPPLAAFRLDWAADEAEASDGLPAVRPGLGAARWGVRDLRRVHWFDNFLPGTGCTLSGGAEYVLLGVTGDNPPTLRVGVRGGGDSRVARVPANPPEPVDGILFEHPAASDVCVALRAWQDGGVWAAAWQGEIALPPARWREGRTLDLPGGQALRLDAVMEAGLPVGAMGGPVWMARAGTGDAALRLREGLFVRHGDGALRYRRLPQAPVMRYTLEGRGGRELELGPAGSVRVGAWTFSQSEGNLAAETAALLRARRDWGGPFQKAGATMAALGAVGWVLARVPRRGRGGPGPPPEAHSPTRAE